MMQATECPLVVEVQRQIETRDLPADADFCNWARAAATAAGASGELVLRVVDEQESAQLNGQYRDKPYATNVLSFPADLPEEVGEAVLGDIAICAPVVRREAREQGKTPDAHWAHMVVHGVLHLCGYDHIQEADAEEMEQLETAILNKLGFADPYK